MISETLHRPALLPLSEEALKPRSLFLAGLGHQKHIWVLARLQENQQTYSDGLSFPGVLDSPKELAGLALFFLLQCLRSSLQKSRAFLSILLLRICKFLTLQRSEPSIKHFHKTNP